MRRTVAAAAVALTLAATGTAISPSYAEDEPEIRSPETASVEQAAPAPAEVLDQAEAALEGEVPGTRRPEATLALRDLFATLPRLSVADRAEARGILARPTNGSGPSGEIKYRTRSVKQCGRNVCVHRVMRTRQAASRAWARKTLRVFKSVWRVETGRMGYRRPVKDGRRGGNGKFDVYLADVGARGLYGYCVPEFTKPGFPRLASGYCVLDNDFARSQFGARRSTASESPRPTSSSTQSSSPTTTSRTPG